MFKIRDAKLASLSYAQAFHQGERKMISAAMRCKSQVSFVTCPLPWLAL